MNDDKKKKIKRGETFFIPSAEFLKKLNGMGYIVKGNTLIKVPESARDSRIIPADAGRGSDDNV
jgi:hypothetical protein